LETFLEQIQTELVSSTYRPMRNRTKEIPKGTDKVRILAIPCIRDRLERAKEVTRRGRFIYIEYARFADDLVILIDGFRKWEWLLKASYKRLVEEFEKLDVQMNQDSHSGPYPR
jgi:hypothetical protein